MSVLIAAGESFCQPHCTTGDSIAVVAGCAAAGVFFWAFFRNL
jgi:hypothetical protein